MTVVYHELLPESYLLILAPSRTDDSEAALAHSLHCAQRSGKAAVWIDCGMLHSLSDEAAQLLWGAHHQLEAKQAKLVLVHVPERVRRDLLKASMDECGKRFPAGADKYSAAVKSWEAPRKDALNRGALLFLQGRGDPRQFAGEEVEALKQWMGGLGIGMQKKAEPADCDRMVASMPAVK